ncbi:MAG: lasso peptide biosynthesis B2 protein [Actinomycetota bacterium]
MRSGDGSRGLGARVLAAVGTPDGRISLGRTLWAYGLVRLHLGRDGAPAAMAWACRPRPGSPADPDAAWAWAHRLVRPGRLPGTCLVRSIVLARVLSVGHGSPAVRLGVRREGGRLRAHAWVELAGRSYGAHPGFEPLGADARPLPDVHDPHP